MFFSLLGSVLLSFFFSCLLAISFVSYSLGYCLVLLVGALSFSGFVFLTVGASWYLLLFCLVYVGGVYVLLVYVSMFNANFFTWFGGGYGYILSIFFFFFSFFDLVFFCLFEFWDCGHYLCLSDISLSYCFFCVVLLIGFCLVSFVSSSKDSFIR